MASGGGRYACSLLSSSNTLPMQHRPTMHSRNNHVQYIVTPFFKWQRRPSNQIRYPHCPRSDHHPLQLSCRDALTYILARPTKTQFMKPSESSNTGRLLLRSRPHQQLAEVAATCQSNASDCVVLHRMLKRVAGTVLSSRAMNSNRQNSSFRCVSQYSSKAANI